MKIAVEANSKRDLNIKTIFPPKTTRTGCAQYIILTLKPATSKKPIGF
jgi:hypothetical protein